MHSITQVTRAESRPQTYGDIHSDGVPRKSISQKEERNMTVTFITVCIMNIALLKWQMSYVIDLGIAMNNLVL